MNFELYTNADANLNIHVVITSTVNLGKMLIRRTNKNFLKMCGGNFKIEYLYIKIKQ
jgi:hypothetical protein